MSRTVDVEGMLGPEARSPAWLRGLLGLASVAYRAARGAHRGIYRLGLRRRARLGVPVISVGNITTGGVGKTPLCAWLARELQRRGRRPLVLARGYGKAPGEALNDEGRWLVTAVPGLEVVQDPDRVAAVRPALDQGRADLILLDDGFQHERIARDLELVLLDATRPFGFGRLLPRGLLREPPSALARADLIVLTRCEQLEAAPLEALEAELQQVAPGVPIARVEFAVERLRTPEGTIGAEALQGREVLVVCGVGHPEGVVRTVRGLGASTVELRALADHARPSPEQWREAGLDARRSGRTLVVTEKDAARFDAASEGAWVLLQDVRWRSGQERLEHLLERVLGEDGGAG